MKFERTGLPTIGSPVPLVCFPFRPDCQSPLLGRPRGHPMDFSQLFRIQQKNPALVSQAGSSFLVALLHHDVPARASGFSLSVPCWVTGPAEMGVASKAKCDPQAHVHGTGLGRTILALDANRDITEVVAPCSDPLFGISNSLRTRKVHGKQAEN